MARGDYQSKIHADSTTPPASTPPEKSCSRHEPPASVDLIQFYVFRSPTLTSVQPMLETDNFAACEYCHATKIGPHPDIAQSFEARKAPLVRTDGRHSQASPQQLLCDFALPTVRNIFFRQCLVQKSVMPLVQFAKYAITLPPCTGAIIAQPQEYYEFQHGAGFACCRTCFEWFLRHTSFEHEIVTHPSKIDWCCDIGTRGYIFRGLVQELDSPRPDLNTFKRKDQERNALPPCPGAGNLLASVQSAGPCFVYEAINDKAGVFCQACYYDKVKGTTMKRIWVSSGWGSECCTSSRQCPESKEAGDECC